MDAAATVPAEEDAVFQFLGRAPTRRQDLHLRGRADLLRRLGRRLVRARELRHAGADGRGGRARSAAAAARARRSRSSRSSSAAIGVVLGGDRARREGAAGSSREAPRVRSARSSRSRRRSRCRPRRARTRTCCARCRRRAGSLRGSPPSVRLTFSEAVEPRFAIVSVTDANGKQLVRTVRRARSPNDPDTLVVPLEAPRGGLVPRLLAGDLGRRPPGARRVHVRGRAEPGPGAAVPDPVDLGDGGDAEPRRAPARSSSSP